MDSVESFSGLLWIVIFVVLSEVNFNMFFRKCVTHILCIGSLLNMFFLENVQLKFYV